MKLISLVFAPFSASQHYALWQMLSWQYDKHKFVCMFAHFCARLFSEAARSPVPFAVAVASEQMLICCRLFASKFLEYLLLWTFYIFDDVRRKKNRFLDRCYVVGVLTIFCRPVAKHLTSVIWIIHWTQFAMHIFCCLHHYSLVSRNSAFVRPFSRWRHNIGNHYKLSSSHHRLLCRFCTLTKSL